MLSDSQVASLLNAVPSFAPKWAAMEAEDRDYFAAEPAAARSADEQSHHFLSSLASYIGAQFARDEHIAELGWLFAALEPLYAGAEDELRSQLTIGFLESVIYAAEYHGTSAAGIGSHVAGPETAGAWRNAYDYIHPAWEPEEWKVRRPEA